MSPQKQPPLSIKPPSEALAFSASLATDLSRSLAGAALVEDRREVAVIRTRAAPAAYGVVAALVDRLVLIGERVAHIAHGERLGLLRQAHAPILDLPRHVDRTAD